MTTNKSPFKDLPEEYIICSAIYYEDGIKHKDPRCLPRNKETGFYVAGCRHHNCYGLLFELMKSKVKMSFCEEGFLTNKGNFLTRKEAKELALRIGQVTETISDVLMSEDLW